MKYQIEITVPPEKILDGNYLHFKAASKLKLDPNEIAAIIIKRRSIDSRKKPVFKLLLDVFINEKPVAEIREYKYNPVDSKKRVLIIGSGPAGLFAALRLIELGIKPVIIERGKDVQTRRKDLKELQQKHIVNPDSNYCFGEGGAGTYSDGKLYTRSVKRGNVRKVLDLFVMHGASNDILIDAHPHIGSNNLPKVVANIRQTIINNGGDIHFNARVTDFILKPDEIKGVIVNNKDEFLGDAVILATGHSARDIYYLLHKHNIKIEPKPFAMGVRIEHPQQLINEIQYHKYKSRNLPPAAYNLACNVDERGVYTFCMCPGGIIVPSATAPGEIVVNGMSLSRRDSPFANSGLVVSIVRSDWKMFDEDYPFSGLKLQQQLEQLAFRLANNTQSAPAQRVTDFVARKFSQTLPATSYIPGLTSVRLEKELPEFISKRIRRAVKIFNRKMKGYYTDEAILVAAETRTSSPIRIPRDKESLMHIEKRGLFPCGEGAGYAGGIVSAAIDGENCADAVSKYLK